MIFALLHFDSHRNSIHSEHVVVNQLMNSTLTPEDLKDISESLQTSEMNTVVHKLKHAMELVQARTAIQSKYLHELETSEEASCLNGNSKSISQIASFEYHCILLACEL